jgi:chitin disaccharide deacetylase
MRTLYLTRPLFEMLLRVGREEGLPVMVSREWFVHESWLPEALGPDGIALDRVVTLTKAAPPENWAQFYDDLLKNLRPGVTLLIVHLAYDDEEMRAVTRDHPDWGAAWRQHDFDYTTGEEFRRLLKENNVKLITWREVGKLVTKPRL